MSLQSHIMVPKPCPVDVLKMPVSQKGFYCTGCRQKVADLRNDSPQEVATFIRENPGHCVIMSTRKPAAKGSFRWVRMVVVLVGMLLGLSSCHRQRKMTVTGCPAFKTPQAPLQNESEHKSANQATDIRNSTLP